jgi:glycerophosphoryl diester phosphodiesterase
VKKKLIIAHRGASDIEPENTIGAFARAIELGADMIEMDIRMSRDEIPLVFHDDTIDGIPVVNLDFSEIRKFGHDRGIKIPTLEEVLQFTSGKIRLNIELKIKSRENEIASRVLDYFSHEQCILSSFHLDTLISLKELDDRFRVGLIMGKNKHEESLFGRLSELFPPYRQIISVADYIIPHWKLLRFGTLTRVQRHKLKILVWTVNEPENISRYLHDPRISGIITDKTGLAVSIYKRMSEN